MELITDNPSDLQWTDKEKKEEIRDAKEFEKELRKELLKSENRRRRNEIERIKQRNKEKPKNYFTATKLFMYFIFINCTAVEIYSMVIMYLFQDLSALTTLIGTVIGESITFAVYCAKSYHETKEEALMQLERDKFEVEASAGICEDEYIDNEETDDENMRAG